MCIDRGAGQDYRAGLESKFEGKVGVAVPVAEDHGAGGQEDVVEGHLAVRGMDDGLGGGWEIALRFDCVRGG